MSKSIGWLLLSNCPKVFPHRECTLGKSFRFRLKMGGGGGQATLDDIFRRHKLSYETKIVKFGRVVEAGGLGEECFLWGKTFGQFASNNYPTDFDNFYII
ncbi:hypothetical protein AVEN_248768-1 [Araneus ventricosus]|uniref:Uncharacterized protein n=1 Tax=Araneus ventricosus TaxID=182803 RepID=A0A4Y2G3A2_ARAVE|nr:hypothetical protein AVEN_248768-1 [Araneus ventricosus]